MSGRLFVLTITGIILVICQMHSLLFAEATDKNIKIPAVPREIPDRLPYWKYDQPKSQVGDKSVPFVPIEEFIRQIFVDKLPFEEMSRYRRDPKAVQKLSSILEKECVGEGKGWHFCSNIVFMLGILGGVDAEDAIVKFFNQDQVSDFRIKTDALLALGYWINTTEEKLKESDGTDLKEELESRVNKVINDLVSCANTTSKKGSNNEGANEKLNASVRQYPPVTLNCSSLKNDNQKQQASRAAILGLGLSGHKKTKNVKRKLEELLVKSEVGTRSRALIIGALKDQNMINAIGLACFYDKRSKGCQERFKKKASQTQ